MRRLVLASLALTLGLATTGVAGAATVASVFGGRVPCLPVGGVQFCAGTLATRVETWDGVPLDVNVTIPPAAMNGPFPVIFDLHGWGIGKSPQPFTDRANAGYVVVSYSARGFHFSCGVAAARLPDPTIANPTACIDRGWIRLADARYEIRDTQYLAGRLVDEGLVLADRVGVTGASYGGGQSMILAALKNRVMLPDGTLVPWTSPGGTPMRIAAAAPLIPWSDLSYALVPNGRTLDYRALNPYGLRGGVAKQSWLDALYGLGVATGFYAPAGAEADITGWKTRIDAGEPYDGDPAVRAILDEIASHHSAYYVDDSIPPAPLFIYNAFTDDLFPATEALRFANKTRSKYPAAEIALQFADAFGHPRASLAGDMARANQRVDELFARHLKGTGAPLPPLETYTQSCGGSTEQGPFAAPDWASIHPGEVRFATATPQTFDGAAGNPLNATVADPVAGGATSCRSALAGDDAAAATYALPAVTGAGYTLMGSPTVIADYATTGTFAEIAGRLWDVATDGSQALVSQGFYRPRTDDVGPQVFQLPANGWHFAAGHVPKLELLGQSAPFGRASNGTFTVTVADLELRLPVVEAPDGVVVLMPAPPVLPPDDGEPPACGAVPASGCRAAGAARLVVKDRAPDTGDRLTWKWLKGAATAKADFGAPLATTAYALCLYDGGSRLIGRAGAPAGGTCRGKACWRESASGFKYADADLTPSGVQRLQLKAGAAGKAKITLAAKGVPLTPPALPVATFPLTVQLVNGDGGCWQSTHATAQVNSARDLKAQ